MTVYGESFTPPSLCIGTTTASATDDTAQFPLPAVIGAVAAFLGLIVVILVIVIVIVSVHRSKSSSVMLIADDIHDNGAYETANGSAAIHHPSPPKYAQIDKTSLSPPPLPARPSTNMSHSRGNSVMNSVANSMTEIDKDPPGYQTPDIITSVENRATSTTLTTTTQKKPRRKNLLPYMVGLDHTTMKWTSMSRKFTT